MVYEYPELVDVLLFALVIVTVSSSSISSSVRLILISGRWHRTVLMNFGVPQSSCLRAAEIICVAQIIFR